VPPPKPKHPARPQAPDRRTPQMHKVLTAMKGDDEFSVFSTSEEAWQKAPVEMDPHARTKMQEQGGEPPTAGARLLRFFRGFISR
jgi:hypothetical protein